MEKHERCGEAPMIEHRVLGELQIRRSDDWLVPRCCFAAESVEKAMKGERLQSENHGKNSP